MKTGFYFKTARTNIAKNYRFYIPEMLTGTGLLASFYIVFTLAMDERIEALRGGTVMPVFMTIGSVVIGLLSAILILYTNSFLMKQRKREYGLYNVLGMEKKHIGKIVLFETLLTSAVSIAAGLILGILFYKICALFICRLLKTDVILGFGFITPKTIIPSGLFFAALYAATYIINRVTIARLTPAKLLKSVNEGEREPKVKIVLLIIGVLSLGAGYTISVITTNPLKALFLFFTAVFLVIIGTYCLFTAGSVFILKCLKRNKKYYYTRKHMTTVSGLLYRMKQNAVGLASICILSTGVLVMISSTVSLYSGLDDTVKKNYPDDMYVAASQTDLDGNDIPLNRELMDEALSAASEASGLEILSRSDQCYLEAAFCVENGGLNSDYEKAMEPGGTPSMFTFVTAQTFEEFFGSKLELKNNEIALFKEFEGGKSEKIGKTLTINGKTYTVKASLTDFPVKNVSSSTFSCYGIVVADEAEMDVIYAFQKAAYGDNASEYRRRTALNFSDKEAAAEHWGEFSDRFHEFVWEYYQNNSDGMAGFSTYADNRWDSLEAMLSIYGGFLFLGIILGTVCMFATVLIIYYKQISEGYEDRARFQIMKKVGMSDAEIKSSVRSQTLTVFFLPLIFAGIHTMFAFPIINRMLHLLLLSDTKLFVICSLVTYAVFAAVYVLIYSLTARTYYKIVK